MPERFTILRATRAVSTRDPFSGGFATKALADEPPDVHAEEALLSSADVRDAAANPSIVGLAPVMPTKLFDPVAPPVNATAKGAWGIDAVGASSSSFDGGGVRIAILDTGIDAAHPAFAGINLVQADFTGTGNGDQHGHGTHCAGTAFGGKVGGQRIGVATGASTGLIGKVLDANGSGDTLGLANGILWASEHAADVISLSLGFDFPGMVADAIKKGMPAAAATSRALEIYRANLRMFDRLLTLLASRAALLGPGKPSCPCCKT